MEDELAISIKEQNISHYESMVTSVMISNLLTLFLIEFLFIIIPILVVMVSICCAISL
jgi:hypothetical protein